MKVVVSDTSPLRALAHLGRLDLLAGLLGEVIVPTAVAAELVGPDPSAPHLDAASVPGLRVAAAGDLARVDELLHVHGLDPGEAEAIALAQEMKADLLLIDERKAEAVARHAGLETLGVLGLLLQAKRAGLVVGVGPLVDELSAGLNFFISPSLREKVLRLAGE